MYTKNEVLWKGSELRSETNSMGSTHEEVWKPTVSLYWMDEIFLRSLARNYCCGKKFFFRIFRFRVFLLSTRMTWSSRGILDEIFLYSASWALEDWQLILFFFFSNFVTYFWYIYFALKCFVDLEKKNLRFFSECWKWFRRILFFIACTGTNCYWFLVEFQKKIISYRPGWFFLNKIK